MRYVCCPVCEDSGLVLLMGLRGPEAIPAFSELMRDFPRLRAAVWCDAAQEAALLCVADDMACVVPCIRPQSIPAALEGKRQRFLPRPSGVSVADMGIGYWRRMRAAMAQVLYECYLPLLRSGMTLTDQAIAQDVSRMTQGAWAALHEEI